MNLTLTRTDAREAGIFGELRDEDGNLVAVTLEHAYDDGQGGWVPKVATGIYTCKRGPHRLHGMTEDFTTFEIMDVPDFQGKPVTGDLIHWGNWDRDSEGCVLVGEKIVSDMITNSRVTFQKFMALQEGLDSFQLTIS